MFPQPIETADPEFERLIVGHRAQLHGFLLSLVGNVADAEDLLQQVCLILWQKRDSFEPGTNFLAWARKIARYQALNHWRKNKRRPRELELLDEHLNRVVIERCEERELEFARHRKALHVCLEKLPERQREVVQSHYFEGHSVAHIAATSGMKANAVSQLLFRARSSLIRCVQSQSPGISIDDPDLL